MKFRMLFQSVLLVGILLCRHGSFAQSGWFWQNPLPQGNYLRGVFFTDTLTGWAVGMAGTILHTANGGKTWSIQSSGTKRYIQSVFFADAKTGWAVGLGGTIIHTNTGGTAIKKYLSGAKPLGFSLIQNYPNPFNISTTIRFSLAGAVFASLKVVNVKGQEIATLVNGKMAPGIYKVTWNASALPGGVYICRLQTGSLIESKKLILHK